MKEKNTGIVVLAAIIIIAVGGLIFPKNKKQVSAPVLTTKSAKEKGSFSDKVLAGKLSPYLAFNQTDYDKALKSRKVIFLDFYANWCPICRSEEPELEAGFNSLTTDKVVGFRVNWQDSDTDDNERKLAQEFGITTQMTKIILKDGKKVYGPDTVVLDRNQFVAKLAQFTE
ncbi:thioredoxin family protein [Candidatus Roizmanbacteria bacterium]|nr:thioredoxin family protein [Candidatus Roizmanbacteria bacterium]